MRSGAAGDAMTQAFQHPLLRRFIGPDLSTLRIGKDKHLGSFGYRYWGLLELVRSGQVDAYVTRDPEDGRVQGIHPALILSTAEVKLNKNGRLPLRRLLEQADRIMRTEVADAMREPAPSPSSGTATEDTGERPPDEPGDG